MKSKVPLKPGQYRQSKRGHVIRVISVEHYRALAVDVFEADYTERDPQDDSLVRFVERHTGEYRWFNPRELRKWRVIYDPTSRDTAGARVETERGVHRQRDARRPR